MATVFLKDGDENEKKLSQIFSKKSTSEYKEDEANVDKSLTDIENDIKEIQKVINAKDSDPEGKIRIKLNTVANLGDAKAFLENWVSKLESRKKTLQQKSAGYKKNQENNKKQPTTGEPSF